MYQPDPAATLRRMAGFVKPGGIVVFHEIDFSLEKFSCPPCEVADQVVGLVPEAFRRVGLPPDFGRYLGRTYLDAGLPFPSLAAEIPVGGAARWSGFAWFASTVVTLAPRFAELGLSMPPGWVADEALADKLEAAVIERGSQILAPTQFGAWARKTL